LRSRLNGEVPDVVRPVGKFEAPSLPKIAGAPRAHALEQVLRGFARTPRKMLRNDIQELAVTGAKNNSSALLGGGSVRLCGDPTVLALDSDDDGVERSSHVEHRHIAAIEAKVVRSGIEMGIGGDDDVHLAGGILGLAEMLHIVRSQPYQPELVAYQLSGALDHYLHPH
jgi:hypothetical protein